MRMHTRLSYTYKLLPTGNSLVGIFDYSIPLLCAWILMVWYLWFLSIAVPAITGHRETGLQIAG